MAASSAATEYRLLFVDDHPIYCEGLVFALHRRIEGLQVLTARDAQQAAEILEREDIDLVLSDYHLKDDNGIALLARIGPQYPSIAVGLLCAEVTPLLAQQALQLGAIACLSKARDIDSIATALQQLFNGETVFDEAPPEREHFGISQRRQLILRLAAEGLSNKEIGLRLGICERTVKDHWTQIFERLDASNRIQAIGAARALGLL